MTFKIVNWGRSSTSTSEPLISLQSGVITGSFRTYNYFAQGAPNGDGDTQATIAGAGYFNSINYDIATGDVIFAESEEDGTVVSYLATNTAGVITVTAFNFGAGEIGTANIFDGAVTYPKIQDVAASSLLGNPTGAPATVSEITVGNGLQISGGTLSVRPQYVANASGTITTAQLKAMYATPVLLIPNPGANLIVIVEELLLNFQFATTQYAAGGAVIAQYGSTIHGGGVNAASGTIAAATVNAIAASQALTLNNLTGPTLTATTINAGVYLSNQTQAFTTGDSPVLFNCRYRVVAAT